MAVMTNGYMAFAFAVGFLYGVIVGGIVAAKVLGW
jgi:hypothetical protein